MQLLTLWDTVLNWRGLYVGSRANVVWSLKGETWGKEVNDPWLS